jgi:hypothetical protein
MVCGVRFQDEFEAHTFPTARPCSAVLDYLTTNNPGDMMGKDKYLGGVASPCGKYVYGVPGSVRFFFFWRCV